MQNEVDFIVLEGVYVRFPFSLFCSNHLQISESQNRTLATNATYSIHRMILYPAILLTVVPPGIYFPQMANSSTTRSDHEDGSPPALEEEEQQQQQQGSSSVGAVSGDGKMGLVMKEE